MFTKLGIKMTPGLRKLPRRATAPGTTRTPRRSKSYFRSNLSKYSKGPDSIFSMRRRRNKSEIACFTHWCTVIEPSSAISATRSCPSSSFAITNSTSRRASRFSGVISAICSNQPPMRASRSLIAQSYRGSSRPRGATRPTRCARRAARRRCARSRARPRRRVRRGSPRDPSARRAR